LTYRISDYYGRTTRENKNELPLDKEGEGDMEVVMNGLLPGFYAVRAALEMEKGLTESLSTFVVVRPPVDIEKG
jgi:hypothetical protein